MPTNPEPSAPGRPRGPGRPSGGRPGEGRDALLRAARGLLAEKGLPGVTLREVADRAGVNPALVHYYFGGKQGLLRAVVAEVAGRMVERIGAGAAREGPVEVRLRALVRAAAGLLAEEPYAARLVVEQILFGEPEVIEEFVESYARRNLDVVSTLLEAGERSGALRRVEPLFVVPTLLGGCVFFFLSAPFLERIFGIERITPEIAERLADHTVDVLLHGITAPGEAGG